MATRHACLILAASLAMSGCATLKPRDRRPPITPPDPVATLRAEEVISRVNRNAELIQTIQADPYISAKSPEGNGQLSGWMHFERDRNFRLKLKATSLPGVVADLGSNNGGFWFWMKSNANKEAYVCDYDSTGNTPVPTTFQPDWIVESLGLRVIPEEDTKEIDVQEGTGENADAYVLTQRRITGSGQKFYKQTIVDKSNGRIREHKLLGPDKAVMARAVIEQYQSIPLGTGEESGASSVIIPEKFRLYWTQEQLELQIALSRAKVNSPINTALFQQPDFSRDYRVYKVVNLREAMGVGDDSITAVRTTKPPADSSGTLAEYDSDSPASSRVVRRPRISGGDQAPGAGSLTGQVVGARYPSGGSDTVAIPFPRGGD